MNKQSSTVHGPVALKNVASFMAMTMRLVGRASHLPGLGVCHGPSGFGKSWASIYAQNKTRAIRVEVGDSWTRKTLLRNILREFGENVKATATVSDLAEQAVFALGENPSRPLIVDEADRLIDKGMIEIVRELHEASGAPIIMIGEERLPAKLLQVERVHNRVLDWFPAQPCDLEDARALANAYVAKLVIKDDLLQAILTASGGRARRIGVNLEQVIEVARNKGISTVDLKAFAGVTLHTGEPPQTRHIESFSRKSKVAA